MIDSHLSNSDLAIGSFFAQNGDLVKMIVRRYIPGDTPDEDEELGVVTVAAHVQPSTATVSERTLSGSRVVNQVKIVTKENPYEEKSFKDEEYGIRVSFLLQGYAKSYEIREITYQQFYIEALGVHVPRA